MRVRTERRAFTLLELMLVLAVMVLFAAMAMPVIETMYADMKVQGGADHLRGRFAHARTQAIDEGQIYRFAVKPGTGDYRIAPDTSEFWGDAMTASAGASGIDLLGTMPNGIVFQFAPGSTLSESDGWSTLVKFNPDGSCSDDCVIQLDLEDARPVEVELRGLTGAATTRTLTMESKR